MNKDQKVFVVSEDSEELNRLAELLHKSGLQFHPFGDAAGFIQELAKFSGAAVETALPCG